MIASQAHRNLRSRSVLKGPIVGAVGWRDARDEPDLAARFAVRGEDLIGVYENDPGVDPALVVVTSVGLRFPLSSLPPIAFEDVEQTRPPQSKTTGPREIEITLRNGLVRRLPVTRRHGERGRFQDAYAFNLFMMGVVRGLARGRRSDET